MTKPVVTRFAPSPTGFLHIGGARTALFCWLYARHSGGKFLLRIEDTDRERSTDAAIAAILDGLEWLGLEWDGQTVYQFARAARHREVAEAMLANGTAYHCYLSKDELDRMRAAAEAEKRPLVIQSPWRDRGPKDAPKDVKPTVRLKAPRTGETHIADRAQGDVTFANKDLDDLIILRSDGTPTYNHAVVVDDHDMGVTHIIRGVDHLTNAARQTQIYQANGWDVPVFAHVPLIHGADGAKLSKRHGAQGVNEFRAMGYLPEAMRNYLSRLGWSHGDDEIFSTAQMIEWFDLTHLGKSAARFDFTKLDVLNQHYIKQASVEDLVGHIKRALPEMADGPARFARFERAGWAKLAAALPSLKERAKTLVEMVDGAGYLIAERPLALDDKAKGLIDAEAKAMLAALHGQFSALEDWSAAALEAVVRAHVEATGVKLGKVAQPLRAVLTGHAVSPPVFDVMAVLGRDESLLRIKDQTT
jgi:glutamyl-tRNA synthetase